MVKDINQKDQENTSSEDNIAQISEPGSITQVDRNKVGDNNSPIKRKSLLNNSSLSRTVSYAENQKKSKNEGFFSLTKRRSVLKSLATTFGLGSLISGNVRGSDPIRYVKYYKHTNHDEVKRGNTPTYENIYSKISRSKWGKLKTSQDGIDNIVKFLRSEFGREEIKGVYVGTDYRAGSGLTVRYDDVECGPEISYNQLVKTLPKNVRGKAHHEESGDSFEQEYSVSSEKVKTSKDDCDGSHFDSDYSQTIPACSAYQNDNSGICTFGTPAINDNGQKIMITAGHCVDNSSYVYQPDTTSTEDGWVYTYIDQGNVDDCAVSVTDWAEIRPKNGADYQYNFSDDSGGYIGDILGTIAWTEIQSMADNGDNMSKRGWNTGPHYGPVQGTDTECNTGTRFFWTQVERGDGDSGGPYYTSEDANGDLDPEFYIAGIHEGGRVNGCSSGCCGDDYATGPYIGDIENDLNVNV